MPINKSNSWLFLGFGGMAICGGTALLSSLHGQDPADRFANFSRGMSSVEFDHLRIKLPAPVDAPWKGPLYDNRTCFDPDKKLAAVEVLPLWIRQGVLAGEEEMAARWLSSFIKFTEDGNPEVATKAVIGLYRMGDSNGTALAKMKAWLESGLGEFYFIDSSSGQTRLDDIRATILREMDFYSDTNLLETVYGIWEKAKRHEGSLPASVDFAYYLEKHGKELSSEYWLDRLNSPYGFQNALQIVEKRRPAGLLEKLQSLFDALKNKPAWSADVGRAAETASAIFRIAGQNRYRDYLLTRAQAHIDSGEVEKSLTKTLTSLARTNEKAATQVLTKGLESGNDVIREAAADALGNSTDPYAVEVLVRSAQKGAQEKRRFPRYELRALLAINTANADDAYQRVQQTLLSGQFGWSAVSSDFYNLEFIRKQKQRDW